MMKFQDAKDQKEILNISRVKKNDTGWNKSKIGIRPHLQLRKQRNRTPSSKFSGEMLVNVGFFTHPSC